MPAYRECGNSGGAIITFDADTMDIDSGTGTQGVLVNGNTGATVNFTGDLDMTSTSGAGLTVSGGGTINITGAGNTITTTTGRAIRIFDTTIGGSGVAFNSVNTNGRPPRSSSTTPGRGRSPSPAAPSSRYDPRRGHPERRR